MFFDFSNAYNTIQPRLLSEKLESMQVECPLISWMGDYLTGRLQFVRLQSCVSECDVNNISGPHRGLCYHPSCSTSTYQTFNTTQSPAICRKSQTTQPLLDVWRAVLEIPGRDRKCMSRLYFLRRLWSFGVCSKMLHIFYQSVVASNFFCAVVCCCAGIKTKDGSRLNKLIKKCVAVVGVRLAT